MQTIALSRGLVSIVDDDDANNLSRFRWYANKSGNGVFYAFAVLGKKQATEVGRKYVSMHRLLLGFPACLVDHIDGDGLNNQRSNIRLATVAQNQANSRKPRIKTTSRFKGVSRHERSNRWQVFISVEGKNLYGGTFIDEETAARRYDELALDIYKSFAKPNFES